MRILILGSKGFIGSHLCNKLITAGHSVTGCDLQEGAPNEKNYFSCSVNSVHFESLVEKNEFDFCINAAGNGNVSTSVEYPENDFALNVNLVFKALSVLRKLNPLCAFIQISSAAVYGSPDLLPIPETTSKLPLSPYGYHKLISEQICWEFNQLYSFSMVILRPFSIYGPGQRKLLFWDLTQKIKNQSDAVILFGDGLESRDFLHVDDFVDFVELIIQSYHGKQNYFEIYNIGSGVETRINEVTALFSQLKVGVSISFNGEIRKGDPTNWRADISKAKKLGFLPKKDLKQGICEYFDWCSNVG